MSVITVNPWSAFIRSIWEPVHRHSHTLLKRNPPSRRSASGEWCRPCWTSTAAGHSRTRALSPHSSPDSEELVTLIFMLAWKKKLRWEINKYIMQDQMHANLLWLRNEGMGEVFNQSWLEKWQSGHSRYHEEVHPAKIWRQMVFQ